MANERAFLASPIASAGGRVIASPFQFLVDGTDHLRIEGWNIKTGAALEVTYRFVGLDGTIRVERHVLALTADRSAAELNVTLAPGYLVNMIAVVVGATPKIGETFVCIKLIRGISSAAIVVGMLLSGYVTAEQGLGWPGSPIGDSLSGDGVTRTIVGTTPAAGNDLAETVPTGARWEFISLATHLHASATAGARTPFLVFRSGSDIFCRATPPLQVMASEDSFLNWGAGMPSIGVAAYTSFQAGTPNKMALLAGEVFATATGGLKVDDQYGAPTYKVREWLEVDA